MRCWTPEKSRWPRTESSRGDVPAAGTSGRDDTLRAHRDFAGVQRRIDATYDASRRYLDEHL